MSERLQQAVVLAGGRGARLGELTDRLPKPMVSVGGHPFLERLVEQFRRQGFSKVLMLVGYHHEIIESHFGDGSGFGIPVDYAFLPVTEETGARLRHAAPKLDSRFLLTYADNFVPWSMDRAHARFAEGDAWLQLTAYGNRDGYTRSNLRVRDDGVVERYDASRAGSALNAVDIGYMIADRRVVDLIPDGNVSFQKAVFPTLAESGRLTAYVTDHRYYSIGSPGRLPEAERFFTGPRTVLLDRDGVLNERRGPAEYVTNEDHWRWRPGALEALRRLKEADIRTVLITNQPGVARGSMTHADLERVHDKMRRDARAAGGDVDHLYVCVHGWDAGCECRKPAPGMLLSAQRDLALNLMETPFIGDDERDRQAAEAAGCPFHLVDETTSLLDVVGRLLATQPEGSAWASAS